MAALVLIGLTACSSSGEHAVPGGNADRGRANIASAGCGACHQIGGIRDAHGSVGPSLFNVANRSVIGGMLPNTPDNLTRWIEDAPSISPQTAMPNLGLSREQARDIAAYLYTKQ